MTEAAAADYTFSCGGTAPLSHSFLRFPWNQPVLTTGESAHFICWFYLTIHAVPPFFSSNPLLSISSDFPAFSSLLFSPAPWVYSLSVSLLSNYWPSASSASAYRLLQRSVIGRASPLIRLFSRTALIRSPAHINSYCRVWLLAIDDAMSRPLVLQHTYKRYGGKKKKKKRQARGSVTNYLSFFAEYQLTGCRVACFRDCLHIFSRMWCLRETAGCTNTYWYCKSRCPSSTWSINIFLTSYTWELNMDVK